MSGGLRIHPREMACRDARLAIEIAFAKAVSQAVRRHDLTTAEQLRVMHEAYTNEVGSLLRGLIRVERHGDAETPGGIAGDDD